MLPRAEGALRSDVIRLLERLRDWSEWSDESEEGMLLSKLDERSRWVSRDKGSEGKERRVVECNARCRRFGKRGCA